MRPVIPWQRSVHHDGTESFVGRRTIEAGDRVTLRLRVFRDAPLTHVMLWTRPDNVETLTPMAIERTEGAFSWWAADVVVDQPRLTYHFIMVGEGRTFYHSAAGPSPIPPLACFDYVLLAGFQRPDWVDERVFYQIVPDRFRDGDPASNVRDGEYGSGGFTTRARLWDEPPLEWAEGGCLDFYGGDLQGIRESLDYLTDLGVNALYLTPVFHAPSTHKYDCQDYLRVDPHLGGDEALARLTDACHERDVKVVLDISVNHTGTSHRWFDREGLYGRQGAFHHPDGPAGALYLRRHDAAARTAPDPFLRWRDVDSLVTLNYGCDEVRDRIWRRDDAVLKHWLRPPWAIDGWRFDVAYMMGRYRSRIYGDEIWTGIRSHLKALNPACYLVSEDWTDASDFLRGDQFDAAMNYFGLARPLRRWCGEPDRYLGPCHGSRLTAPPDAADLVGALAQSLSRLPGQLQGLPLNLLDSHDWARLHHRSYVDRGMLRGVVALLFTVPGAPCIYYGDEVGIGGHDRSVEGCRWPMPWDEARWDRPTRDLYRTLARLRRRSPALMVGSFVPLVASGPVAAVARFTDDDAVVTVVSAAETATTVALPLVLAGLGDGTRLAEVFDGHEPLTVAGGWADVRLPARGALVFSRA